MKAEVVHNFVVLEPVSQKTLFFRENEVGKRKEEHVPPTFPTENYTRVALSLTKTIFKTRLRVCGCAGRIQILTRLGYRFK